MSAPLYICSSNAGKVREFELAASLIPDFPYAILPLPGIETIPPPDETGRTFEENAALKASYYASYTPEYVFADDSGLEVDALGGAPGVFSARFAGAGADDRANNELLLERLAGKTDRAARFVCVVALARAGKQSQLFRGTVEGRILSEPRGSGGFGYDPLFYYPPFGKTLAEVEATAKLAVSHRGAAFRKLLSYLAEQGNSPL